MFKSLLRTTHKGRRSETTPLLAALQRYRSRQNDDERSASEGEDDYPEDIAQYDGDYEEGEDDDGRRDGPLLPVFSSEVLGS